MSYFAVVLDEKSRCLLLERVGEKIPESWEKIAHHMTIHIGAPRPSEISSLGSKVAIEIVSFSIDSLVAAVCVGAGSSLSDNKKPHVTVAVNREAGGKPFSSNNLKVWESISPFWLTGTIQEYK